MNLFIKNGTDTICAGDTLTLHATGNVTSYSWSPSANLFNVGADTAMVSPMSSGVYTVTGTDANGCTGIGMTSLVVKTTPTVTSSVSPNDTVCAGTMTTLAGMGAVSYSWSGGITNNTSFTPTSSGSYIVTGTGANGCSAMDTVNMTINSGPSVSTSPNTVTVCSGSSAAIVATGASTYLWSLGSAVGDTLFVSATATSGSYLVTGTDAQGCTDVSTFMLTSSPSSGDLTLASAGNVLSNAGLQSAAFIHPNDGLTYHYYDASCNLISSLQESAGGLSLGLVNAQVSVGASTPLYNGQPYIARWYDISPANQGSATVTLYFTDDDFIDYNAGNGSFPNVATNAGAATSTTNLAITKTNGPLGTNAPTVINVTANWNSGSSRWEVSFPVTGFSQFRLHTRNPGNTPLLVDYKSFTVRKLGTADLIEWTTVNEFNSKHFNIQRSADGLGFETLGQVSTKAQNDERSELSYSFEDKNPQIGHNYYRLEQVGIDHKKQYTDVIDIIWRAVSATGNVVNIYPNPAKDKLNVDISLHQEVALEVRLVDMSGRVVKLVHTNGTEGLNSLRISLDDIAPGVYGIQIYESGRLTHVNKVRKN